LWTFKSDWSNLGYNIYHQEGGIFPKSVVARPYALATPSCDFSSKILESFRKSGEEDISIFASKRTFGHVLVIPLEMAIDYYFYDFEIAEPPRLMSLKNVLPNPSFFEFVENEYFVADSRGYKQIVHNIALEFLDSLKIYISDNHLKLKKVVREIQYTNKGVNAVTKDGSTYTAENTIVSVSMGVLQTKLIKFKPDLPLWKLLSIYIWDTVIYCKIFMIFRVCP
jgi:polyamine oxidase